MGISLIIGTIGGFIITVLPIFISSASNMVRKNESNTTIKKFTYNEFIDKLEYSTE